MRWGFFARVAAMPTDVRRSSRGAFRPWGAALRMLRNRKAFVTRTLSVISPETRAPALPPLEVGSPPGTTKTACAQGGLAAASGVAGEACGR